MIVLAVTLRRTPKYREIASKVGTKAISVIHKHVNALVRKGWLLRPSPHELEIIPAHMRNGLEWRSCDRGHARCWFQVENCPACRNGDWNF